MIRPTNKVPMQQQNTPDIQGYYYTAADGSQMAFWTCMADRISKEHQHDYDEYMVCLSGEYVVTINGVETVLHSGDELFIPKGTVQGVWMQGWYQNYSCIWRHTYYLVKQKNCNISKQEQGTLQ